MDLPSLDSLISAKEAAKRVGYSPDYIAKLAREGEIVGRQVGRAWFVEPASLEVYAALKDVSKAERASELSQSRLLEYRASTGSGRSPQSIPHVSVSVIVLMLFAILAGFALVMGAQHLAFADMQRSMHASAHRAQMLASSVGTSARDFLQDFMPSVFDDIRTAMNERGGLDGVKAGYALNTSFLHASIFSAISASEEAMLQAYATVGGWWNSARRSLANLFMRDAPLAVLPAAVSSPTETSLAQADVPPSAPSEEPPLASTEESDVPVEASEAQGGEAPAATVIYEYVPQTTSPHVTITVTGVSRADLDKELAALDARITSLAGHAPAFPSGLMQSFALTNAAAGNSTGATANNLTVAGVTGLTDADIPDAITASNYLPLAGSSVTGALDSTYTGTSTWDGNLHVKGQIKIGTSSAYLSDTGLTAAGSFTIGTNGEGSTLALQTLGRVGISSSTPWGVLSVEKNGANASMPVFVAASSSEANPFLLVDYRGRVGIGTSSPADTLALNGAAFLGNISAPSNTANRLYANTGDLYWAGSIIGGATTGTWTSDGTNVWRAGGSVGIGTTSPWAKLSVEAVAGSNSFAIGSSTSSHFVVNSSGNVGIGTASPSSRLTLANNVATDALDNFSEYQLLLYDAGTAQNSYGLGIRAGTMVFNSDQDFDFDDSGTTVMTIVSGSVGIGTTSPWGKLSVTNTGSGPSFVVEDDTSPDSTPFIIDASGNVGIGTNALVSTQALTFADNARIGGPQGQWQLHDSGNGALDIIPSSNTAVTNAGIQLKSSNETNAWNSYFPNANGGGSVGFQLNMTGGTAVAGDRILDIQDAGTTRFTVTTPGNVGIGTTTPSKKLEIYSATNPTLRLDAGVGSIADLEMFFDSDGETRAKILADRSAGAGTRGFLSFYTNNASDQLLERMRLDEDGSVGIGTTTPTERLSILSSDDTGATNIFGVRSNNRSVGIGIGYDTIRSIGTAANQNITITPAGTGQVILSGSPLLSDGVNGSVFALGNSINGQYTTNGNGLLYINYAGYNGGATQFRDTQISDGKAGNVAFFDGSTGNVGIGTTSPLVKLHINASGNGANYTALTGTQAIFENNGGASYIHLTSANGYKSGVYFGQQGSNIGEINADSSDSTINIQTGSTKRLTITTSGNVGIGTTSPYAKLSVTGAGTGTGVNFQTADSSNSPVISVRDNGTVELSKSFLVLGGTNVSTLTNGAIYNPSGQAIKLGSNSGTEFYNNSGTLFGVAYHVTDSLGQMRMVGSAVGTPSYSFNSDTNTGLYSSGADTLGLVTGGSERVTVNSSGNVGIGTTSPYGKLAVSATGANTQMFILNNSANSDTIPALGAYGGKFSMLVAGAYGLISGTLSSGSTFLQAQRVDGTATAYDILLNPTAGNVGIGTTTPRSLLSLNGGFAIGNDWLNTSTSYGFVVPSPSNSFVESYLHAQGRQLAFYANPQATAQTGNLSIAYPAQSSGIFANTGNDLTLGAGGAEAVRIQNGGNVGIGTTSPQGLLHTYGATSAGLRVESSSDDNIGVQFRGTSGNRWIVGNNIADGGTGLNFQIYDWANSAARMTINSSGNVGIGTTTPARILDVYDNSTNPVARFTNAGTFGSYLSLTANAAGGRDWRLNSTAGTAGEGQGKFMIVDQTAAANRLVIDTSGNVGIGTTSPVALLGLQGAIGVNSSQLYLDADGDVGIGTAAPAQPLHVSKSLNGTMRVQFLNPTSGTAANTQVLLGTAASGGAYGLLNHFSAAYTPTATYDVAGGTALVAGSSGSGTSGTLALVADRNPITLHASTNGSAFPVLMTVLTSGNVGIGTTTPVEKLSILSGDNTSTTNIFAVRSNNLAAGIGIGYETIRSAGTNANQNIIIDPAGTGYVELAATTNYLSGDGGLYTNNGTLNAHYGTNGNQALWLNYVGYNNGTTQFRDTFIGDGKTNALVSVIGSTGNVGIGTTTPSGNLVVNGTTGQNLFQIATSTNQNIFTVTQNGQLNIGGILAGGANTSSVLYVNGNQTITGSLLFSNDVSCCNIGSASQSALTVFARTIDTNQGGSGTVKATYVTNTGGTLTLGTGSRILIQTNNNNINVFDGGFNQDTIIRPYSSSYNVQIAPDGGNVGIGTTSPTSALDVAGAVTVNYQSGLYSRYSTGASAQIFEIDTGSFGINNTVANVNKFAPALNGWEMGTVNAYISGRVGADPNNGISFGTNSSERMRIGSNGNVGIGTTSPVTALHVQGSSGTTAGLRLTNASNWINYTLYNGDTANNGFNGLGIYDGSAYRLVINSSGNVGIGTTTPDKTLVVNGNSVALVQEGTVEPGIRLRNYSYNTYDIFSGGGGSTAFDNKFAIYDRTNSAARLIIDNTGNVGIGTTTPQSKLHVSNGFYGGLPVSNSIATFEDDANAYISINTTDATERGILFGEASNNVAGGIIYNNSSTLDGLQFRTNGNTTRMVVNSSGNVGIGTTSPTNKLDIFGTVRVDSDTDTALHLTSYGSTNPDWYLQTVTSAGTAGRFRVYDNSSGGTGEALTILRSGNVGIGTTSPIARLSVEMGTSGYPFWVGDQGSSTPFLSVDGAGNVGIGRASTGDALHIGSGNTGTSTGISIDSLSAPVLALGSSADAAIVGSNNFSSKSIEFRTGMSISPIDWYSGTTRMVITSAGNVGIGTTTPQSKLSIVGDTNTYGAGSGAYFTAYDNVASNVYTRYGNDSTGGHIYQGLDNKDFRISVANTDRFHITYGGNVGIGTTSPSATLAIAANGTDPDDGIYLTNAAASGNFMTFANASTAHIGRFYRDGNALAIQGWTGGASGYVLLNPTANHVGVGSSTPFAKLAVENTGSDWSFAVNDAANDSTPFVINAAGQVLIGTTTDAGTGGGTGGITLDANGTSLYIDNNSGGSTVWMSMNSGDDNLGKIYRTGNALAIDGWDGGANGYVVLNSGTGRNVGVGTTSPWRSLGVTGTVGFDGLTTATTGNYLCLNTTTKEVTSGTTCSLSSERFKTDIATLSDESGLAAVLALRPVSFRFVPGYGDNGSTTQIGFIAEEAAQIDGRLVTRDTQGRPNGFVYANFTAILAKATQEIATVSGVFKDALIGWLGDANNGIQDFFAKRTHQETLCVGKVGDETCITKAELDSLLAAAGSRPAAASASADTSIETAPVVIAPGPTITLIGASPLHVTVGSAFTDPGATATDPVDGAVPVRTFVNGVEQEISAATISTAEPTTYIITYSATNAAGNSVSITRSVIVGNPDGTVVIPADESSQETASTTSEVLQNDSAGTKTATDTQTTTTETDSTAAPEPETATSSTPAP